MTRVFLYGTLKKDQSNNFRMFDSSNGEAEFLGTARTAEKYPLVIAGVFNVPYLLNIPGQGNQVHGEIYKVDDKMLRFLDAFEDVPSQYQRTLHKLEVKEWVAGADGETLSPGSSTKAYLYSTTTYKPEWVTFPTYENYNSKGEHGLEYVAREARDS